MATREQNIGLPALDSVESLAERLQGISDRDGVRALEAGLPGATRLTRRFLREAYNSSGLGKKSGDLYRAVGKAEVELKVNKTGRSGLRISFPNVGDEKFYTYAGATNYGATHGLKDVGGDSYGKVGQRRRKQLKTKLERLRPGGRAVSAGQNLILDAHSVKVNKYGSKVADTNLGRVTVTKAYNYFKLTPSKQKRVIGELFEGARVYLDNVIKKAIKGR